MSESNRINEDEEVVPPTDEEVSRPNRWEVLFKELSTAVLPLLTSVVAALTLSTFFFDSSPFFSSRSSLSEQEKMFTYLEDGVKRGNFSENYFNTAFNHYDRKAEGDLSKYGRVETVEDFIVFLNSSRPDSSDFDIKSVESYLSKVKAVEPFSALPAEERRLMDQLQLLISESNNSQRINQTLNELKQVILARYKEYQKIESQNSWSLPLSFIGVFLTLVFGIWTTVLSIRQSRSRIFNRSSGVVIHSADGRIRKL